MNHVVFPESMQKADIFLQRLRNDLDDKITELEKTQATYAQENEVLQARIIALESDLTKE